MRFRDAVVTGLAVAALLGLWSQEGSLSLDFAFVTRMISVGHHRYLPPPVATDIDGDGTSDLLVVTQPDRIGIVHPENVGAHVAVQLAPSKFASFYANVIGMSAGYLSFPNVSVTHASKEGLWFGGNTGKRHALHGHAQHVAVVTDDYKLTVLNSKLEEVWQTTVVEYDHMSTVPRHASVTMLPDSIFEEDKGMIVVAVPTVSIEGASELSVAAFCGQSGELRWRHTTAPSQPSSDSDGLHFKFAEKDLVSHANSRTWQHFRDSVIASMPHTYSHPWHNKIVPYRFVHSKNLKKREPRARQSSRPKEHHAVQSHSDQDRGLLGERLDSAAHGGKHAKGGGRRQHVRPLPNTLVLHTSRSVEYVHLFTGRTITAVGPLKPHVTYDDVNDDLVLDSVSTNIGVQQSRFARRGMDEQFVCAGEVHENAPASNTLMSANTICDTEGVASSLGLIRHIVRGDTADKLAAHLDPLERLGSTNVASDETEASTPIVAHVRRPLGRHIYKTQRLALYHVSHGIVTAVNAETGAVVWRVDTPSAFSLRARDMTGDTAVSTFRAETQEEKETQLHHFPHLVEYTFHDSFEDAADVRSVHADRHRHHPIVVVVGGTHVSLVSTLHGRLEATATVDHLPVAPTLVADLNGDGVNDLLVTTPTGYHCYFVRRHTSGSVTAAVLGIALAIVAVLFLANNSSLDFLGNTAGVEEDDDDVSLDDPVLGNTRGDGLRRRAVGKRSTD